MVEHSNFAAHFVHQKQGDRAFVELLLSGSEDHVAQALHRLVFLALELYIQDFIFITFYLPFRCRYWE